MHSVIYTGILAHVREKPRRNAFRYGVYMLYLDLDELDALDKQCRLFARNRFGLLSFHDKDHFRFIDYSDPRAERIAQENVHYDAKRYRDVDTRGRIALLLQDAGLGFPLGRVGLLTNPRVLGYVFNPVSLYYCYDTDDVLRVVLTEVNNTFGDQKMYVVPITDPSAKVHKHRQQKNFYVSPYIDFDTDFEWQLTEPGEQVMTIITSMRDDEAVLRATFTGKRRPLTDKDILAVNLRYPLLTLMVIFRIHYQAFILFLKKLQFRDKQRTDEQIDRALRNK